jgi:hypothetical protein
MCGRDINTAPYTVSCDWSSVISKQGQVRCSAGSVLDVGGLVHPHICSQINRLGGGGLWLFMHSPLTGGAARPDGDGVLMKEYVTFCQCAEHRLPVCRA